MHDTENKINFIPVNNQFKILLTKNSYFITPSTAEKIYDYMNVIRFPMKL